MNEAIAKKLALGLAALCVRNSSLENIHAGIIPNSQAGDYSDVFVSTPEGNIPWSEISKISDAEMKVLMQEVVNKIYTVLLRLDDPEFVAKFDSLSTRFTAQWDQPNSLNNWFSAD